jgi:hypothetical protein
VTDRIYVENGVGRAVMDAINLFTAKHGVTAEWQHDIHPEMQRPQHGDEWWIEDITARDMAILTQDTAILEGLERQTVIDSGAKVVALANAKYSTWQKLRCVVQHWDAVERLLAEGGPGAVVLSLSGKHTEI